uniref:Macaca fascicularis brain cDNA clone: QtrA-15931, similar to human hypothetical protein FLJ20507 (FLJ20507), mRNA, RefSeq: NM_017849.1 n=1 Tax=Macaca fascicularis TaxID=9541 RepID=I7GNK3_MACFA|nr:unnamed protein product [Macaca fascicularis]
MEPGLSLGTGHNRAGTHHPPHRNTASGAPSREASDPPCQPSRPGCVLQTSAALDSDLGLQPAACPLPLLNVLWSCSALLGLPCSAITRPPCLLWVCLNFLP